jgi:hypothetical protein
MAERREFDVLCLDVLDRGLGRKGVSREVFRGQLRELGIHILTTEPSDHSDDDSLEGQLMRLLKGYKAEEEVNDFVRRSKNGIRHKALGNPGKGIAPRVIGNGIRTYGYKFIRDSDGKVENLEPNHDVIYVDSKGTEWTEVRVIVFIFKCAKRRIPIRQICQRLNNIGIPAPCISIGRKYTSRGVSAEKLLWQVAVVSKMLRNTTYSGKMIVNGYHTEKVPGRKSARRIKNPSEERIIVPVPAIVNVDFHEEVLKNLQLNQLLSLRNNQQEQPGLFYGGLAKCGNCGRTASMKRTNLKAKGSVKVHRYYQCISSGNLHKCIGCHTNAILVENTAWECTLEIINNPSLVDEALEKKRSKDPTARRRKQINQDLAKNKASQKNIRADLIRMSGEGKLDLETEEAYLGELKDLKHLEQIYNTELADDEKVHQEWETMQKELERVYKKCATMREKLKKPGYEPNFKDKRDCIEFFGMTATLWEEGHINPQNGKQQRIKIQARFGDIVLQLR